MYIDYSLGHYWNFNFYYKPHIRLQCQSKTKDKNQITNKRKREEQEKMKKDVLSLALVVNRIWAILHCTPMLKLSTKGK